MSDQPDPGKVRLVLAPGYARCLAGYMRASASMLDAEAVGDSAEFVACLNDRREWQHLLQQERAYLEIAGQLLYSEVSGG